MVYNAPMANNLVPGGARPGLFQTRRNRIVRIEKLVLQDLPLESGQTVPKKKEVYQATLMKLDGITPETLIYYEKSGALVARQGVSTDMDLAQLVKEDPPVPETAPAAGELAEAKQKHRQHQAA